MARLGIALDLGTSGFRGQAVDLDRQGSIVSTAVTTRHPFPGANVMDHLHYAIELGLDWAQDVVVRAVNKVMRHLRIDGRRGPSGPLWKPDSMFPFSRHRNPGSGVCRQAKTGSPRHYTGTGVIALISEGLKQGLIKIPEIQTPDGKIHLPNGIGFTREDLLETGKAIGAIRAGHITLCQEAGISSDEVETAYMSGASGTYVDAIKAQRIRMIPPGVKRIYQVGNTSLAMARDLVMNPDDLWRMKDIAEHLRQHHCMFASSKTFEKEFILESSYWTDGMSMEHYQNFLKKFKIPQIKEVTRKPTVIKTEEKDIADPGVLGLRIIPDIGERRTTIFEGCVGDSFCVSECPEHALTIEEQENKFRITQDLALCNGVACRRFEKSCEEDCFDWTKLITSTDSA